VTAGRGGQQDDTVTHGREGITAGRRNPARAP
jgi:hypothetical protein